MAIVGYWLEGDLWLYVYTYLPLHLLCTHHHPSVALARPVSYFIFNPHRAHHIFCFSSSQTHTQAQAPFAIFIPMLNARLSKTKTQCYKYKSMLLRHFVFCNRRTKQFQIPISISANAVVFFSLLFFFAFCVLCIF